MTTQHDYKAAEEWIDSYFRGKTVYEGHPLLTIYHALRLADAVQRGPSEDVCIAFETRGGSTRLRFKAAIAKLLEEIEG